MVEYFPGKRSQESEVDDVSENIMLETTVALNAISELDRALIGHDAPAVVRTAIGLRTKDGLTDGAIDRALEAHAIHARGEKTEQAYRNLLLNVFIFGTKARENAAARKEHSRKEALS